MVSLKEKTISSLFWKFMERGGNQVIALIVQVVLARLLTPDDFGILAILIVVINIGNIFVQSGLGTSLIQAPSIDDEDYSSVFWTCLFISIAVYGVIFMASPFISNFYNYESLSTYLRVMGVLFVISSFTITQTSMIQRELQYKKLFYATVISTIISGTTGIILALYHAGVWALIFQQLIYYSINLIVLTMQTKWRPKLVFSTSKIYRHFKFGWRLLTSQLLNTFYKSCSDLIIGKLFSASDLGLVSQGKRYPEALGILLDGSIQPVMLSIISKIQDNKKAVKNVAQRALQTATFLIFPIMVLVALIAEPLIVFILGEHWIHAVPFFQMYCIVFALFPASSTNLQVINGLGRSDIFFKLECIKVSYGMIILLITSFVIGNIYAIVAGYILTGFLGFFVNAIPNKHLINYSIKEQLKDVFPSFLLTFMSWLFAFCITLLPISGIMLTLIQIVVFFATYILLAKILHTEALIFLMQTLKEFKHKRESNEQH